MLFGVLVSLLPQPAKAQHSNALNWTQSTCSAPCAVTGNKVYRTKTQGTGYVAVQTFNTPTTTYTDLNVAGNDTWFYVVTATCVTCQPQESAFSTEVKATTPGDVPPGAPPSLTVVSK